MVFTVHELGGLLLTKVVPTFIHYPFPIVNGSEYERVFRRSPMARHKQLKISFDATIWDEPVITANYEVQRFFLERVGASAHANRPASFHTKITEYLLKNAYHGIPSLEEVSGNFNMTPRSLQRRLREEGTTFQQAIDSARKTLALHYLSSGHYRVKEISSLLGYNEISAFSRAFKRWTGKAPMTYSA